MPMVKWDSLLIFGPPGSGKGTLAKVLAQAGGHYHCSSGDIFRAVDPHSEEGKKFASYSNRGQLVPDEVTIETWVKHVERLIAAQKYFPDQQLMLLDGVPRTLGQAQMCQAFISVKGVVVLQASEQVLLERMQKRASKEGRSDDADAQVLKTRIEVYHKKTAEVLNHYPRALLTEVNADQPPLVIVRDVLNSLVGILSQKFRL
ncbi:MAG: nucleoside monophosphate kinase [Verrucomicrobia bacterium]|nr:nucleoside monophosphate kinase [Verrucomicrobiota bacterium]